MYLTKEKIEEYNFLFFDIPTIVTLFNAERLEYKYMKFTCRRTLVDGSVEWTRGRVQPLIYGPSQCKMTTFRLVCPFYSGNLAETLSYEIGMKNKELQIMEFRNFSLTRPEKKKRSLVSCMSRMIAFDDWALLLFVMETFRLHGGDLVVAYVNCALKQSMELMKLYEKEGLMAIRHGYKAPQMNGQSYSLPYDPDSETEYSHQMTNSHECLYEFKDSAEFIAFTDWDDVLISPKSGSFVSQLQRIANLNPFAASFSITRLHSHLPTPFTKRNKFSLERAVNEITYSGKAIDPKVVVRPERVAGVWIHWLMFPEKPEFNEVTANREHIVILHTHNLTYGGDKIDDKSRIAIGNATEFLDGKVLENNLSNFFGKYNFPFNPSSYPDFKIFYYLILKCYQNLIIGSRKNGLKQCPTYKTCEYPKQEFEVVKIRTEYREPLRMGEVTWHERSNTSFVEAQDGCL
ncbi:hypothetical protein FO519_002650 [Halicephalobus sp. NKZ332]|nr:hypothetical protein FO519_002650 [Halicephalobus sp. NKZ332]